MNPTSSYDTSSNLDYEATTVAAAFADRDRAHEAASRLHDEGFGGTWIGITRGEDSGSYGSGTTGETRVESENWFTRFFGEGDESLHDALVKHGVSKSEAMTAGNLAAGSAILTVDGANHPELAAQVISECGGKLITSGFGATGYTKPSMLGGVAGAAAAGTLASGTKPAYDVSSDLAPGASLGTVGNATDDRYATDVPLGGVAAMPADYGKYRGGASIDEDTRLQLREERLRIDKQRLSRGSATVGKEVVSQTQEIDVPLIREELFIERRAVSGSAVTDTSVAPIGSDTAVINVPLTEERVNVSKAAFVTEEVVVGKRQVEETAHVSETTRKEVLSVDDVDVAAGTIPGEKRF